MRRALLVVLLSACHGKPAVDRAELERLRAEQRELRAKIDALQSELERLKPPPFVAEPSPVPLPPTPDTPRVRPLLTNVGTPEAGAVVTTNRLVPDAPPTTPAPPIQATPPVSATPPPVTRLRTEDLHGQPPSGMPVGADAEGSALLELQTQMQVLQKSQAAQQSALDQIEQER